MRRRQRSAYSRDLTIPSQIFCLKKSLSTDEIIIANKDTYKKPSKSVINLLWLDLRSTFFINLFHKSNQGLTDNTINDITIRSKQSINALGIQFDSKMNWKQQISNTINKSRQALITCHQTNKKIFCQKDFQ